MKAWLTGSKTGAFRNGPFRSEATSCGPSLRIQSLMTSPVIPRLQKDVAVNDWSIANITAPTFPTLSIVVPNIRSLSPLTGCALTLPIQCLQDPVNISWCWPIANIHLKVCIKHYVYLNIGRITTSTNGSSMWCSSSWRI